MLHTDGELRFTGDTCVNPKVFTRTLRDHISPTANSEEVKRQIRAALKGDAELSFDINSDKLNNYHEFEKVFLQYYWGEQAQARVREMLFFGKYDEVIGTSREKYAMRKYAIAIELDPPPMAAQDIIKYIARHFDDDVRNVIAIQDITNIDRLLQYLRRVDDIKRTKRVQFNKNNDRRNSFIRREAGSTSTNQLEKGATTMGNPNNSRRYDQRYDRRNEQGYDQHNNRQVNGKTDYRRDLRQMAK